MAAIDTISGNHVSEIIFIYNYLLRFIRGDLFNFGPFLFLNLQVAVALCHCFALVGPPRHRGEKVPRGERKFAKSAGSLQEPRAAGVSAWLSLLLLLFARNHLNYHKIIKG